MQTKGELAFSTIVVAIIALSIMVLVLAWMFPSFSEIFKSTEDVKDAAIGDELEIQRIECERWCLSGNKVNFCGPMVNDIYKEDCKNKAGITCEAIDCTP